MAGETAPGRLIATSVVNTTTGTQTYYDGANPVIVRESNNVTRLFRSVWSPADGRLILRDASAAQLASDTGLTITANYGDGILQRLYPLTDAQGSIVAVTDPSGNVQERYIYTVDGSPQAINANWTFRYLNTNNKNNQVAAASQLAWDWLYRGEHWVQVFSDRYGAVAPEWRRGFTQAAPAEGDGTIPRTPAPCSPASMPPATRRLRTRMP